MHQATPRERVAASFAAFIMLAMIPLPFPLELLGAVLVICACTRYDLSYASRHTLRMLDLTITFTIAQLLIVVLKAAVQQVASDAGLLAPPHGVSHALILLRVLVTTGYLLLMLGYLVCALLGRDLKPWVSLGMLEALWGRRVA